MKNEKKEIKLISDKSEAPKKKKKKFQPRSPRTFMFWMDLLALALIAVGLYFGIRYIINEKFVSAYQAGDYQVEQQETLQKMNLVEQYLPYYNLGNVAYKEEDYTKAIGYYKQALDMNPPEGKDCAIRINLALAMIKKIDFSDLSTEKKLQNAIQQLRAARTVLTAHGCAGPVEADGHSEEAEKLKKDIDDMLEQLENPPDQDQQDGQDQNQDQDQNKDQDNQDQNNQDQDKETEQEKKIREQLEEQQKEALQERSEEQQKQDDQRNAGGGDGQQGGNNYDNNSSGKNW